MSVLTAHAKGRACLVRVPGICLRDPLTVVAAHYRSVSLGAGSGHKPPDFLSARACARCHDAIDFRIRTNFTRTELRHMHLEAIARNWIEWAEAGLIQVGE